MSDKITIALSKGRILKQTLPLFEKLGIVPTEDPGTSRSLIIPSSDDDIQFIIVRSSDAPTYVRLGAADIGIVGKDTLMEMDGAGVVELMDLHIAKCRISVAGPKALASSSGLNNDKLPWQLEGQSSRSKMNVASKYTNIARQYFAEQGQQCEVIKLYGAMELAPLTGLADLIVDLVDTGSTLKANNLIELSVIAEISSRLVANQVAFHIKQKKLAPIIEKLASVVDENLAKA